MPFKKDIKLIWSCLDGYQKKLSVISLVAVLSSLVSAIIPFLYGKLVDYALSKGKKAIVRLIYEKDIFSIAVIVNTYMSYFEEKSLDEKTHREWNKGDSLAGYIKGNVDGAKDIDVSLLMSKAILDGIAREAGILYTFGPQKSNNGYAAMKICFHMG